MARVASLYLPQLAIERLRRIERPDWRPEPPARGASSVPEPLPRPVDDDPGACSVPRGGGWRPGARWAQGMADRSALGTGTIRDKAGEKAQVADQIARLPAHQRPPMRELGRRSEAADPPFRAMRSDEAGTGAMLAPFAPAPIAPGSIAGCGRPMVLIERSGQREIVTAACPIALSLGLGPGMAAAHARALIGDLDVRDADPLADRAWLDRLALHALRHWTPTTSVSLPDGLWLDLTGTTHLFGGERRFAARLVRFLARLGLTARIAIAGSAGAAHALARYGATPITIVDPMQEAATLHPLPVCALRLEPGALDAAMRFGIDRIGDLYAMPRGPLARRLGLATVTRLDQALGRVSEPIVPVTAFETPMVERRLVEPIATADSIARVIADLVDDLVLLLQQRGLGVRTALLTAERVDGDVQRIAIGASRATRDARHLVRMFGLKIDRIEPDLGIETMRLSAPHSEPLAAASAGLLLADDAASADLAPAIDQLVGRAGEQAVFRASALESDVPERAVTRISPLAPAIGWPQWKRPARMLKRPERLAQVVALLPDHPPRRFVWRKTRYSVVAGDGPERIHGEWWLRTGELWAVRDYFQVEVQSGERFWVFRRGDGVEPETGDLSWYLHGIFG